MKTNQNELNRDNSTLEDTQIMEQKEDSKLLVAALSKIYFRSFYIDLRRDTVSSFKNVSGENRLELKNESASSTLENFILQMVHPDEQEKMRKFVQFESLPQRLKDEKYLDCDYIGAEKKRWCCARYVPVKHDEKGYVTDVIFLAFTMNSQKAQEIENERIIREMMTLQQRAAELVATSQIVAISVINIKTGETLINKDVISLEKDKAYHYDIFLSGEEKYVIPEERSFFREHMKLTYILEVLEESNHCKIEVNLVDEEGGLHHIQHHYAMMGDGYHLFSVAEDNTNCSTLDHLTKCMNKEGFLRHTQFYLRGNKQQRFVMLCFNLQKFKAINSQYGYERGDELLQEVARRIKNCDMMPLLTCREMADSFFCVIRLENFDKDLLKKLCHFYMNIGNMSFKVALNCGVYYIEDNQEEINTICDKARIACHVCREKQHTFLYQYSHKINQEYLEQAYILQNFETALQKQQFKVVYQPIYDAWSKKIVSAEALVRWEHPNFGMISPGAFLPAIEKSGNIPVLDYYVAQHTWDMISKRYHDKKHVVPVSVNMSRYVFFDQHSMEAIIKIVDDTPLMREYLRTEITESGFGDIGKEGEDFLDSLRKHGCKILMDDFGSGYSSLGMLAQCECDYVKLDMSFTENIGKNKKAEHIIIGAIQVIHQLGAQIVAEGVETDEQYRFLKNHGCDYIQGYYFSKPLSEQKFEEILDKELTNV